MGKIIINLLLAIVGIVSIIFFYPFFSVRSPYIILLFIVFFLQVERIQNTKSLSVNKWVQFSNVLLLVVTVLLLCVALMNGSKL